MSWSFYGVGKPKALVAELEKQVAGYYPGQSKIEFEEAAPHLKGLILQVPNDVAMSVNAAGHATFQDGKRIEGNIQVEIKTLGHIYE